MSHQMPDPTVVTLLQDFRPTLPFVTTRSKGALEQVRTAFTERLSLVILHSGWDAGSNHLVRRFLAGAGRGITVASVARSCASEVDALRAIIQSIGIDPKGIADAHLLPVFRNFLEFRRKRKRRTILIMEESATNGVWVCDLVNHLVKLETEEKFGLFIVLSRHTRFIEPGDEVPLEMFSYQSAKHVSLTPFTQADTREFIRWRVHAAETADLGQVLDFQACTLIHEFCDGMPDSIERLFCASLELADREDTAPVTTDIVMRARNGLRLQPASRQSATHTQLSAALPDNIPTLELPDGARLVVSYKGEVIRNILVDKQRLSIGRSDENDLSIMSKFISRQHAAIFRNGADTAVVDLESKNGTFVNSRRIQVQTLSDQDEISIGQHTIRFIDANATEQVSLNGVVHNRISRPRSANIGPPVRLRTPNSASVTATTIREPVRDPD